MESSARGNISNTWPVRMINLYSPDLIILVKVLENRLTQNFVHVNVRLVDCPDLSQEPFNLAAPGLCGQTAYIEIGDMSYLKPVPRERPIFPINEIIKFLNRDCRNSFIFGNGVIDFSGNLDEMILNASFLPATNGVIRTKNKSHIVSVITRQRECNLEILRDYDSNCSRLGTFFLCEGLTGPVLEVRDKKHHSTNIHPLPDNKRTSFDVQIHRFDGECTHRKIWSIDPFVILGGVYVVENALWKHELVQNSWESFHHDKNPLSGRYCHINVPETVISTFNSSITELLQSSELSPTKFARQSTHSLSHHNGIGCYDLDEATEDGIEYLGYFCPAQMVYRFDDPHIKFPNLQ